MKITKTDKTISFEYPLWRKRYNFYDEETDYGNYPIFTGLIIRHRKDGNHWDEIGFTWTIDMTYSGKSDQVGGFAVMWEGNEKDFISKCKELGFGVHFLDV